MVLSAYIGQACIGGALGRPLRCCMPICVEAVEQPPLLIKLVYHYYHRVVDLLLLVLA